VRLDHRLDAFGDDLRLEPAGGAARGLSVEDDLDFVGAAEVKLIADRLLKPRTPGLGAVEHAGIGQLELTNGVAVAVAAALTLGERGGKLTHPPVAELEDVAV
jgi:hypothetical protein